MDAVNKAKDDAEATIKEKTGEAQKEADALSEQIRDVAKSAKETLKAHGKQKMETLEAQKAEAEEAAALEKTRALEELRIAASLEVSTIHQWKIAEDKQEHQIMKVLHKEKMKETTEVLKDVETFDSLEAKLTAKEAALAKATATETEDIEAARQENYQLEQLKLSAPTAEALEDELGQVKATLSSTLNAKKTKMNAENDVEATFNAVKEQGRATEQEIEVRKNELEKLADPVTVAPTAPIEEPVAVASIVK